MATRAWTGVGIAGVVCPRRRRRQLTTVGVIVRDAGGYTTAAIVGVVAMSRWDGAALGVVVACVVLRGIRCTSGRSTSIRAGRVVIRRVVM